MPNPKDLTGQVFERLTVREKTVKRSSCGSIIWLCDCSCGNTTYASTAELTKGARKSCGCYNRDKARLLMNRRIEADCVDETRLSLLNQKVPKNNTSGVRGVYLHKSTGKWVATIRFQKKNYYLGYFNSLDQAAKARRIAEETLWQPMQEKYVGSCTTQQEREEKTRQYLAEKVSSAFNDLSAYD